MDKHEKLEALRDEYIKAMDDLQEQKDWAMAHGLKVLSHAYAAAQATLCSELNVLNHAKACYN